MEIGINKKAMDRLMPLCKSYGISPRWALIGLINHPDFDRWFLEMLKLESMETNNNEARTTQRARIR